MSKPAAETLPTYLRELSGPLLCSHCRQPRSGTLILNGKEIHVVHENGSRHEACEATAFELDKIRARLVARDEEVDHVINRLFAIEQDSLWHRVRSGARALRLRVIDLLVAAQKRQT